MNQLLVEMGVPSIIVQDKGTEFTSMVVLRWGRETCIDWHYIVPEKPTQSAFIESFKGNLSGECLNEINFSSMNEARLTLEDWQEGYNTHKPLSALGNLKPRELSGKTMMSKMAR
ncbi:hypothetical protein NBRC116590_16940 [Pelagimonas sp. KU-00592-HH]|uniref:integrase core domain-containing protein n=1 Tax=Pelagimonas sp. KU-00592-HH TaxID=3127651 RepID=UPI003108C461